MAEISLLDRVRPDDVEALLDAAFGDDRKTRTAYRLREGVKALPLLSFAAVIDGRLVGTLQSWPVALDGACCHLTSLTLVGPVAVLPGLQRGGLGKALMDAFIAAADVHGHDALMMIGDPEYYGRFFGFVADACW